MLEGEGWLLVGQKVAAVGKPPTATSKPVPVSSPVPPLPYSRRQGGGQWNEKAVRIWKVKGGEDMEVGGLVKQ